jgi:hypothetical protein
MEEPNSTRARLKLWGEMALRPESWPLEFIFLYALHVLGLLLFDPAPAMTKLESAWHTFATIMTNPVALIFLVLLAVLLFQRGINRVLAAQATALESDAAQRNAAFEEVKAFFVDAAKLPALMAASGEAFKRAVEADLAIAGIEQAIQRSEQFAVAPSASLSAGYLDHMPIVTHLGDKWTDDLRSALPAFIEPVPVAVLPPLVPYQVPGAPEASLRPEDNPELFPAVLGHIAAMRHYVELAQGEIQSLRNQECVLQGQINVERIRLYGND